MPDDELAELWGVGVDEEDDSVRARVSSASQLEDFGDGVGVQLGSEGDRIEGTAEFEEDLGHIRGSAMRSHLEHGEEEDGERWEGRGGR